MQLPENDFWSEADDIMSEEDSEAIFSGSSVEAPTSVLSEESLNAGEHLAQDQDDEDDPNTVRQIMSDARLRLEQGRLYEMLLEHSLFGDVEANPQAIKNVEREIRRFIRERLEVLLGLREDPRIVKESRAQASDQFTPFEVDFIKKLIAKTTGGLSQQIHTPPKEQQQVSGTIRKVASQDTKPLSSKISPAAQDRSLKKTPNVRVSPPKKAQPAAPAQPAMVVKTKQGIIEIPEEVEEPLGKPAHRMSRSDLTERNRRIAERQAGKKAQIPSDRLPTPTPDQAQAMVVASVMGRMQNGKMANGMMLAPLINKIVNGKNEGEE